MIEFGGLQRRESGVQDKVSMNELRKAVHELKNGKITDVDEVCVEMIKCNGERRLKLLWNICLLSVVGKV